ncbi:MAG: bifunctional metallophosphatase/5'-nucleotidase, partial [Actinomycetota bacterium]
MASVALGVALLAMAFAPASAAQKPRVDFLLTILHNNDGESALLGEEDFGGVARFKSLVDRLKFEATHGPPPAAGRGAKRGVVML